MAPILVYRQAGGGIDITRVYYHVLGSCIFGFGLLLLIKLPSRKALLGNLLLHLPNDGGSMAAIRIVASLLQVIGILVFLRWFREEGKANHVKNYERYEPLILIFLVFFTPWITNAFIDSTIKAFVFAGESNSEAVEYVKSESSCTIERNKDFAECIITLRNYKHSSLRVTLELTLDKLEIEQKIPVYLLRHQEKKVFVQLPIDHLKQQKIGTKLKEQPNILIE